MPCFQAHARCWWFLSVLVFAAMGCKRTPTGELRLTGIIEDARLGSGLMDVDVVLEEQVVDGGVWVGNWTEAGASATDGSGAFQIAFQRKNVVANRVRAEKSGWFPVTADLSPEAWRGDDAASWDAEMVPMAWVDLAFANAQPFGAPASVAFRFLHLNPRDLPIHHNEWGYFAGDNPPVDALHLMEGDQFLPFTWTVEREGETTAFVDSVYLSRLDTIPLTILF